MWITQEPKNVALWNKRHFEEKNGKCAAFLKYSVLIFVEKIYKMQHLEGSGTPVLYTGRTVLKGYFSFPFCNAIKAELKWFMTMAILQLDNKLHDKHNAPQTWHKCHYLIKFGLKSLLLTQQTTYLCRRNILAIQWTPWGSPQAVSAQFKKYPIL
jgi:hypothetical protein